MRKATKNDMRQRLHQIIFIAIVALLMTGCTGKVSRSLSDIPVGILTGFLDNLACKEGVSPFLGSHAL